MKALAFLEGMHVTHCPSCKRLLYVPVCDLALSVSSWNMFDDSQLLPLKKLSSD